jgi:hypothetical protein
MTCPCGKLATQQTGFAELPDWCGECDAFDRAHHAWLNREWADALATWGKGMTHAQLQKACLATRRECGSDIQLT